MEIRTFVKPVKVEMSCPRCGSGRMLPGDTVLTTYPLQYPHECNSCGYTETYRKIYPYIEYEEWMDN